MSVTQFRVILSLGMFFSATLAWAADPTPAEMVPFPKEAREEIFPECPGCVPDYPRTNPYDVWQFYGVDREGFWRPRVIYSPYQPYYLSTGEPYPFTPTHQRDIMPYAVD